MIPPKVDRTPKARRDLIEIAVALERNSRRASARFLDAADATFTRLARSPESGPVVEHDDPATEGLRYPLIHRFRNYVAFYRPIPGGI